jgi:hypothetical protein
MQVFELVKAVLDENYAMIPGTPKERDARICKRLKELQKGYSALANENAVAYDQPSIRFAYIYRYVTSHANLVYQCILNNKALRNLFQHSKIIIGCIGGGPGSDLVGILKFMSTSSAKPAKEQKLQCHILDGESGWADAWSDVGDKLNTDFKISLDTCFIPMDVTNESKWSQQSKYLKADLFTMVYFASEIYSKQKEAVPFFKHVFAKMKPGAFLLYIDNNAPCFTDWFDSLVKTGGLEVLQSDEQKEKMTTDEQKTALGEYLKKFPSVKLEANVAFRVCKKPTQS